MTLSLHCLMQSAVASDRAVRPAASPSAFRQQAPPRPRPKEPEAPPPGRKLGFSDSGASSSGGTGGQDSSGAIGQAAPPSPSSSAAAVNGLQARSSSGGDPSRWVTVGGTAQRDAGGSAAGPSAGQLLSHGTRHASRGRTYAAGYMSLS